MNGMDHATWLKLGSRAAKYGSSTCGSSLLEPKHHKWVPSPTGVGLGMLIPGYSTMPMVLGGVAGWLWAKSAPETERTYSTPLASGFIAGEALLALAFSIAAVFGFRP